MTITSQHAVITLAYTIKTVDSRKEQVTVAKAPTRIGTVHIKRSQRDRMAQHGPLSLSADNQKRENNGSVS